MHAEGKEEVYARPSATYRHGKLFPGDAEEHDAPVAASITPSRVGA